MSEGVAAPRNVRLLKALLLAIAGCHNAPRPTPGRGSASEVVDACVVYQQACLANDPSGTAELSFCLSRFREVVGQPLEPTRDFIEQDGYATTPAVVSCLANAGADCNAARACFGGRPCQPSEYCDGDQLHSCNAVQADLAFDCAAFGTHCMEHSGPYLRGAYICTYGDVCTVGGPTQCKGNTLTECSYLDSPSLDCSRAGQLCLPVDANNSACTGTGAACTPGPIHCDGDAWVECANQRESRVDCTAIGLHCEEVTTIFCGRGSDCDPVPYKYVQHCDGNDLLVCDAGVVVRYDCAKAGFSGCSDPDTGPTPTPMYAHCVQ